MLEGKSCYCNVVQINTLKLRGRTRFCMTEWSLSAVREIKPSISVSTYIYWTWVECDVEKQKR